MTTALWLVTCVVHWVDDADHTDPPPQSAANGHAGPSDANANAMTGSASATAAQQPETDAAAASTQGDGPNADEDAPEAHVDEEMEGELASAVRHDVRRFLR